MSPAPDCTRRPRLRKSARRARRCCEGTDRSSVASTPRALPVIGKAGASPIGAGALLLATSAHATHRRGLGSTDAAGANQSAGGCKHESGHDGVDVSTAAVGGGCRANLGWPRFVVARSQWTDPRAGAWSRNRPQTGRFSTRLGRIALGAGTAGQAVVTPHNYSDLCGSVGVKQAPGCAPADDWFARPTARRPTSVMTTERISRSQSLFARSLLATARTRCCGRSPKD